MIKCRSGGCGYAGGNGMVCSGWICRTGNDGGGGDDWRGAERSSLLVVNTVVKGVLDHRFCSLQSLFIA